MERSRILIVEDESIIAMNMERVLQLKGYYVLAILNAGEDVLGFIDKNEPDVILMDIILDGEMDGIDTVKKIREHYSIPVIYVTAHSDEPTLARAKETEPYGYILKPINNNELYSTIELALFRHEMEQKIKKSEERLSIVAQCSSDLVYEWIIEINKLVWYGNIDEALGYSDGELDGSFESLLKLIHPDDINTLIQIWEQDSTKSEPINVIYRMRSKDGSWQYWENRGLPVIDDNGKTQKYIGACTNITERKLIEEQLKKQNQELETLNQELIKTVKNYEEQNFKLLETQKELEKSNVNLHSLIENTEDFIMIGDKDGKPILFNSAYANIMKLALGIEMKPGIQPHKLLGNKDVIAWWDNLHSRVLGGEKFRIEYSHKMGKDDLRHLEVAFHPIIENNKITGFSEFTRDITERKNMENELKEKNNELQAKEEQLNHLFLHAPIGIIHFDEHGVITECNKIFADIIGTSREKLIGFNIIKEMKDKKAKDTIVRALEKGEGSFEGTYQTITSNKKIKIKATNKRIENSEGKVIGGISIIEPLD